jgi:hypothetical protein
MCALQFHHGRRPDCTVTLGRLTLFTPFSLTTIARVDKQPLEERDIYLCQQTPAAHSISYALRFVAIWCRSAQTTTDYYTRGPYGDDVTLRMAIFAFDSARQLSTQFAFSSAIGHLDCKLSLASLNCFPPASDFGGLELCCVTNRGWFCFARISISSDDGDHYLCGNGNANIMN